MAGEHADVLRESLRWVVEQLMETEMTDLIGAAHGERTAGRAPFVRTLGTTDSILGCVRTTSNGNSSLTAPGGRTTLTDVGPGSTCGGTSTVRCSKDSSQ